MLLCYEDQCLHLIFPLRDTVSSVGITRRYIMPGTNEINDDICYFRHALAVDERRVKFLPEYVRGGASIGPLGSLPDATSAGWNAEGSIGPRVKEVWFAGCHSDM